MAENTPNWESIRQEYIETDISMRALAEKYGVNFETLAKRAKREKWTDLRKDVIHKASTKLIQKAASNRARIAAMSEEYGMEVLELALSVIKELKRTNSSKIDRTIGSKADGDNPPTCVSESRSLDACTTAVTKMMHSLGLDAESANHEKRLELDMKRFEAEKADADNGDGMPVIVNVRPKQDGDSDE